MSGALLPRAAAQPPAQPALLRRPLRVDAAWLAARSLGQGRCAAGGCGRTAGQERSVVNCRCQVGRNMAKLLQQHAPGMRPAGAHPPAASRPHARPPRRSCGLHTLHTSWRREEVVLSSFGMAQRWFGQRLPSSMLCRSLTRPPALQRLVQRLLLVLHLAVNGGQHMRRAAGASGAAVVRRPCRRRCWRRLPGGGGLLLRAIGHVAAHCRGRQVLWGPV